MKTHLHLLCTEFAYTVPAFSRNATPSINEGQLIETVWYFYQYVTEISLCYPTEIACFELLEISLMGHQILIKNIDKM